MLAAAQLVYRQHSLFWHGATFPFIKRLKGQLSIQPKIKKTRTSRKEVAYKLVLIGMICLSKPCQ